MKKTPIDNLELDLYYEKLDNGLEVYIVPKTEKNNIYVTYTTKFGSNTTEFVPKGETEMVKVPAGVAHFLEHKMFEQEDGVDPFYVFDKNGASANAFTSNTQTTYLFSGPDKLEENLSLLLNYVGDPYFTDENVEKEKGIIIQEINMSDDDCFRRGYNTILKNSFVNHPLNVPVIGNIESVNSIVKDDLYKCYNTFYNPSNMFLVITGNVDPEEVMKIIKINFRDTPPLDIITKKYEEPDNIVIPEETIYMNVTIPKVYYGFKINMHEFNLSKIKIMQYLTIYFDALFGSTSDFGQKMKIEGITNDEIEFMLIPTDDHILAVFIGETEKIDIFVSKIRENLNSIIDKKVFDRKKKVILSSTIYMTDDIYKINARIMGDIINNGILTYDIYNQAKELNYEDLLNILNIINYDNNTILFIKPNK